MSQLTANWNGSYTYDANGNTLAEPLRQILYLGPREPSDSSHRARHKRCFVVVRLRAIWLWLLLGVGTAPVDSREAGLAVFNLTV